MADTRCCDTDIGLISRSALHRWIYHWSSDNGTRAIQGKCALHLADPTFGKGVLDVAIQRQDEPYRQ